MNLSMEMISLLFMMACLSGFIDAIAGGGGLITIPALLATGLPPAFALGTNKLQACGGSLSASLFFIRKNAVKVSEIFPLILLTFLGAALGTLLVQHIDGEIFKQILPFLVLIIGCYFLFSPNLGEKDQHKLVSQWGFALTAGFGIGFYDGFFGPGSGSLYSLAFVLLLGFNLPKATAHAKLLNFTSNFASLLFFILGGNVIWWLGLFMLVGQFIGAYLGAHMVLSQGKRLIRPLVVLMSFILTVKMTYEQGWFN